MAQQHGHIQFAEGNLQQTPLQSSRGKSAMLDVSQTESGILPDR